MSVVGLGAWERPELLRRIARLEEEHAALGGERERLEAETQRLEREREQLRADNQRLRERNERLREEIQALRRAAKRQAAPFSKGAPTSNPKRAGRRPGAAYGQRAWRRPPQRVDRAVTVALPGCCPGCGGELVVERVAAQYVEELPEPASLITRFEVQLGRCVACGRRVQPRHPEQTSTALGAAGAQLGPRAVTLAAWLSKQLGAPVRTLSGAANGDCASFEPVLGSPTQPSTLPKPRGPAADLFQWRLLCRLEQS